MRWTVRACGGARAHFAWPAADSTDPDVPRRGRPGGADDLRNRSYSDSDRAGPADDDAASDSGRSCSICWLRSPPHRATACPLSTISLRIQELLMGNIAVHEFTTLDGVIDAPTWTS